MKNLISKYGFKPAFFFFALFLFWWIFFGFSILLFTFFLITLFLFRGRKIPNLRPDSSAIISPVDGKICAIKNINHRIFGSCIELKISNSILQNGQIFSPFEFELDKLIFRYGLFLSNRDENSAKLNERILFIGRVFDAKVGFAVRVGSFDRKLKLDKALLEFAQKKELPSNLKIQSASLLGFSMNGSFSLYLPNSSRLNIAINDKIRANSLLGYFS